MKLSSGSLRSRDALVVAPGVALLAMLVTGCGFDPTFPEGTISCRTELDCPPSYLCSRSLCYPRGSDALVRLEPDGGAGGIRIGGLGGTNGSGGAGGPGDGSVDRAGDGRLDSIGGANGTGGANGSGGASGSGGANGTGGTTGGTGGTPGTGGTVGSKKDDGLTCASGNECNTGLCVDGVCCNSLCTGLCRACNLTATLGTCTSIPTGQDPASECTDDGSCGHDGLCDGAGACRFYSNLTSCAAPTCAGTTLTAQRLCDGVGACRTSTTSSCAPYACGTAACKTGCGSNSDCATGSYCRLTDSTCQPQKGIGSACSLSGDCSAGNCVDGYCCNSACGGPCRACNVSGALGTCTLAAAGQDPENDCPDDGASSCGRDGTCDGAGACRSYSSSAVCAAAACRDGLDRAPARTCDGAGTCRAATSTPCLGAQQCSGAGICACPAAPAECPGAGTVCAGDSALTSCSIDGGSCTVSSTAPCPSGQYCVQAFPAARCALPSAVGYHDDFNPATSGSKGAGSLSGQSITIAASSTIRAFGFISRDAGPTFNVTFGLYRDGGGSPTTLVAKSEFNNIAGAGRNELPAIAAVGGGSLVLSPGVYWIMATYEVATSVALAPAAGPLVDRRIVSPFGWGSLPQTLSGVTPQNMLPASVYYITVSP